jgi:hypothetical protein
MLNGVRIERPRRQRERIMTIQDLSGRDELAEARRAHQSRRARLEAAPTVGAPASTAADQGRWLTVILRPAGTLDKAALRGLAADPLPPEAA